MPFLSNFYYPTYTHKTHLKSSSPICIAITSIRNVKMSHSKQQQQQGSKSTATKLTDEQIEELWEAFSLFDTNADGTITSSELGTVLRSLGKNVSDAEVEELLKEVSADFEGRILFADFVSLMTVRLKDFNSEDELKEAFRIFDRNGNGLISAEELRAALKSFGEQLTEEEVDELLREADTNCDGQIDYEEFVKMITQK
ncbi:calmodulin-like [Topomyia yanbarensis]|uniref:calmodulin-like n=1 Tax=Topomyia yanbarensis TaxID=2498891 RepID=UPI00273C09C5|nr:calmodulin-like [Topomyia yanbarensis]